MECAAIMTKPKPLLPGLPHGVRATKIIRLLVHSPPPKPLCFDRLADWQEYLMLLHTEGRKVIRREDRITPDGRRVVTNAWDRIDYCQDCQIGGEFQTRMQRERRCILPPGFKPKTGDDK